MANVPETATPDFLKGKVVRIYWHLHHENEAPSVYKLTQHQDGEFTLDNLCVSGTACGKLPWEDLVIRLNANMGFPDVLVEIVPLVDEEVPTTPTPTQEAIKALQVVTVMLERGMDIANMIHPYTVPYGLDVDSFNDEDGPEGEMVFTFFDAGMEDEEGNHPQFSFNITIGALMADDYLDIAHEVLLADAARIRKSLEEE